MELIVACIQLNSGADIAQNIETTASLVEKAVQKGASFITTPENTFLMDVPGAERALYTTDTHPGIAAAKHMAQKNAVWLLIGSVAVVDGNQEKYYNRSILFDPNGDIVCTYDKIHLFDVDVPGDRHYRESDRFLGGNKAITANVSGIKTGLTICYDVRFPHLYRALAKAGALIITVPSAFTKITGEAHWHTLLRARAIENGCFIIAPAQTGTHPGDRKTFGHSLIIDPWGRVLADGGLEVGITLATIDLGDVEKTRARLPSLEHDRDFL